MEAFGPILAGVACGIVGGAPYFFALRAMRKNREASIGPSLIAACLSFVVVALSIFVGWAFMRSALLEFAVALVVSFLAIVVLGVVCIGLKSRP